MISKQSRLLVFDNDGNRVVVIRAASDIVKAFRTTDTIMLQRWASFLSLLLATRLWRDNINEIASASRQRSDLIRASCGEKIIAKSWLMRDIWQTINVRYRAK
ncbi:MAG TPA: hypothetical protein VFI70_10095 [Nitrososphaeraceae archaeon]|nr:hypothetical protein [Nitrososphaeraceae archaeon]